MRGWSLRRITIVVTTLVLVMSAAFGFLVGGGPDDISVPIPRPENTQPEHPATPAETPGDLPPFFKLDDNRKHLFFFIQPASLPEPPPLR